MLGRALVGAVAHTLSLTGLPASASQSTAATRSTATRTTAAAAPAAPRAIVGSRLLGRSVRGRPIYAWRLGQPTAAKKVVVLSTMHGNEPHTRLILTALRDGRPIRGVDLWVVPTMNPDGLVRGTRKNARGVDLNRNFPHRWRNLDGRYESGRAPASEPETRAVMRFLAQVRPRFVVSFHQPLYGVDMDTKFRWFARRLADELNLPRDSFNCGGTCYGTMTGWYNARYAGGALTVEYGRRPSRKRMTYYAPRQLLRALGAWRV